MSRLFCVLLLMGSMISSVLAQTDGDFIAFYTPIIGTLQPDEVQTWRFLGSSGAMISFSVEALDDTLDPILTIATTEGNLITNDDGIPNDTTARIEAFTVPTNGPYLIKISGLGDKNQGQYRLIMNPGFASIQVQEDFSANPVWQTLIENTGSPLVDIQTTEENIRLILDGVYQNSAITVGDETMQFLDYYTSIDVSVTHNRGWEAGLLLRYQDDQNYYLVQVNSQAQWRAVRVEDGEETVLRDWARHPALRGTEEFTLGALIRGDLIEVFYNHQGMGSIADSTFDTVGRIGFLASTANVQESQIDMAFDNWLVTTPFQSGGERIFPQHILTDNGDLLIRELQRQQLIPAEGSMISRGSNASVRDVAAGITRLDFQPASYKNFVLAGDWSVDVREEGIGGCGFAFRQDTEAQSYMLAYLDNQGAYGVAHREPDSFDPGIYGEGLDTSTISRHVVLVVWEDQLYLYIDGEYMPGNYEGLMDKSPDGGPLSHAVVNFDAVPTRCVFNNLWLWRIGE